MGVVHLYSQREPVNERVPPLITPTAGSCFVVVVVVVIKRGKPFVMYVGGGGGGGDPGDNRMVAENYAATSGKPSGRSRHARDGREEMRGQGNSARGVRNNIITSVCVCVRGNIRTKYYYVTRGIKSSRGKRRIPRGKNVIFDRASNVHLDGDVD